MSIPTGGPSDRDQWMSLFSTLDDDVVDALLEGHAPDDAAELDELAAVMRRLRASADREPIPPMSAALRSQVTQPNVVPLGAVAHARRSVRAGLLAAAAAAAVVVVGVGAEQNRLPADLQDVVASVADLVGVDVPRTDERPAQADADGDGAVGADDGTSGSSNGKGDGATPADPGQPGDKEPATPATPPEHSSGGGVEGGGVAGTPGATAPGQVNGDGEGGDVGEGIDPEVVTGGAPPSTTRPSPSSTTPDSTPRGGSNRPTTADGELESEPPGGSSTPDAAPGRGKK